MLIIVLLGSLIGSTLFTRNLMRSLEQAANFQPLSPQGMGSGLPSVTVIVPAYNEAETIIGCLKSVLESTPPATLPLEVWVVDDQSTDQTLALVQSFRQTSNDPRLHVLAGQSRPTDKIWVGKNWACAQAVEHVQSDFILFIDADVCLQPGAIARAVYTAEQLQADLLTVWITILCDCWGEWLVQPIIASLFAVGFEFDQVNDPQSTTVFAVGPFMLFRRTVYEKIGGHRAVASEVVEDVELGRRVKQQGFKLWYGLGHDLASVRMYRSLGALWEGWTKNWYLASKRNLKRSLYSATIAFVVFVLPWLGWLIATIRLAQTPVSWVHWGAFTLGLIAIALQYNIRHLSQHFSQIPPRYWWLSGVGGLIVTAIPIASIIKTETGWGWTWRGRQLQQ